MRDEAEAQSCKAIGYRGMVVKARLTETSNIDPARRLNHNWYVLCSMLYVLA
ncbi:hypothetical protein JOD20_002768 [Herpetosiphon giganteus]|nr:hypothetical protein [Herpetosiphon giganteus]